MKKILVFMGTRPEAIKMIPIYQQLKAATESIDVKLVSTGQHKEMVNQILSFFDLQPDFDLGLMTKNQSLAGLNARALQSVDELLKSEKPDWVLVQGDTTTAFSAALAAFYSQIPVGHIEAGLRTYDIYSPFPEEANRKFISCIASHHFASTSENQLALQKEGITNNITVTGNTVIDTLLTCIDMLDKNDSLREHLVQNLKKAGYTVNNRPYALVTGHRRESFGQGFLNICTALAQLAKKYPHLDFVYPVHLNPNVKDVVYKHLGTIKNIILINPLNYGEFVYMMQNSRFILTDSGGVQEEAPSLKKPVFVMRDKTERIEAIEKKLAILVGTDSNTIVKEVSHQIDTDFSGFDFTQNNPYGHGNAAALICDIISAT